MVWQVYDRAVIALGRDDVVGARALLAAADADDRALLLLGQLESSGRGGPADPARARGLYERAAAMGNADAAYNLAALHALGRGGPADPARALRWYERAAGLGDAAAHRMAGVMYANGEGTPVDLRAAEEHWRAAAAAGDASARYDLGTLCTDPVEAADWFLQAGASQELARLVPALRDVAGQDRRACCLLGVILAFRLGQLTEGLEFLTTAAQAGDPVAQRSLGFLVEHDPDRALQLYRSAAEAGDGIAAFNVAVRLGDSPESVGWLRQAAEAGVTEAYPLLADRLGEQDLDEEALRWYLRGAAVGNKECMFIAACWYRDGFGGPVDLVQALRWFLAMLDAGSGDGIHEAHRIVPLMSVDDIHEAGRLSGRRTEADLFTAG